MKNNIFLSTLLLLAAVQSSTVAADAVFYGDYKINAAAVICEDDYNSPLNPGNIAALNDLTLSHALTVKLSAGDDTASLELWAELQQQGDPLTGSLSNLAYNLNLQRAGISWYMSDNIKFKLGRHSILTGYGYGWNPIDFANPLKNPADPGSELTGADILLIHLFPDAEINLKLYGLFDTSEGSLDYKNISPGAELIMLLPFGEARITGLYDWDESAGEDNKTSAAGLGLFMDIAGIGVYGEGAVLNGSRSSFADPTDFSLSRKNEILFNALGGIEYTFEFGLTAIAEYFYNGEGCNRTEMTTFTDALNSAALSAAETGDITSFTNLSAEYRQGNFSRHYVLLNLLFPLYDLNLDISGTALFAADSGSLALIPLITWWASGELSLEAGYAGIIDLYGYKGSEAVLSPADHAVTLTGRFNF